MKTNERALDIITAFEGFSAAPYQCPAGVWTIGYGSTRAPGGAPVRAGTAALSETEAKAWMRHELERVEHDVSRLIAAALTENQFGALVSFTYNLGSGNLAASTLRQKLNRDATRARAMSSRSGGARAGGCSGGWCAVARRNGRCFCHDGRGHSHLVHPRAGRGVGHRSHPVAQVAA